MHSLKLAEIHLYMTMMTMEESCFSHKTPRGQVFNSQALGLSTKVTSQHRSALRFQEQQ